MPEPTPYGLITHLSLRFFSDRWHSHKMVTSIVEEKGTEDMNITAFFLVTVNFIAKRKYYKQEKTPTRQQQ